MKYTINYLHYKLNILKQINNQHSINRISIIQENQEIDWFNFFIQKPKTDLKAVKTQVGSVKLARHQLVLPKSTMWAPI
jgi:hypothetical protein